MLVLTERVSASPKVVQGFPNTAIISTKLIVFILIAN